MAGLVLRRHRFDLMLHVARHPIKRVEIGHLARLSQFRGQVWLATPLQNLSVVQNFTELCS
jgi:hypothetical protein